MLYIARSRQALDELYLLLDDVLDPRMYSSFHNTTASAPSLRAPAADPYATMAPPAQDDPGNIKVVVRCRTFLKRGSSWQRKKQVDVQLTRCREGQGHPMPDPHGPSHREDDAARPRDRP